MQALVAAPRQAVRLLRERLQPVRAADPERIGRLLAALDEKRFALRRQAEEELAELRDSAEPALRRFLKGDRPLEARQRAAGLLKRLEVQWREPSPERLRFLRAVEVREWIETNGAREVLEELAGGAPGARATEEARAAVQRLERGAVASR